MPNPREGEGVPIEMGIDTPETRGWMGGLELRRIVYTEAELAQRVTEMGTAITEAYPATEELLVVGLLKGSFIFMADLVRHITRPLHVDFLVASSYGAGTTSSGEVRLLYDPAADSWSDAHAPADPLRRVQPVPEHLPDQQADDGVQRVETCVALAHPSQLAADEHHGDVRQQLLSDGPHRAEQRLA